MTIKDFNEMVENDYWNKSIQSIDPVSDNWFPLMKFDEKYGAILSCLIFLTTLSFLMNGFSFSIVKDITMLGISLDLTLKHFKKA